MNKVSENYSKDFRELSTRLSQEEEKNSELMESLFEQEKVLLEVGNYATKVAADIEKLQLEGIKIEVVGWDDKVKELEAQLEDEREVGIRARRIYKALQSNPETHPVSLEHKARALYVFTEKLSDRTRNENQSNSLEEQLAQEFDNLPISQKEEMMEIYIKLSEGKLELL